MSVKLVRACIDDAEVIWKMQIEAFSDMLQHYQDYDISPGNEAIDKVLARFKMSFTHYYFICHEGEKVGVIRVVDPHPITGGKRISPIFIMKDHRGHGYGRQAILEAEKIHGADNWSLDTILQEKRNCHLYESLGYVRTGKEERINEKMTIIYYEKK